MIKTIATTSQERLHLSETGKGIEFSIRTIAMIALGIMVIVLIYVSFETWFTEIVEQFLGNIEYAEP